jgi:small subunit ribosomal protein S8
MRNLKQISRPGRRIFASTLTLWQVPSTTGIYILSTPRGIMTDNEARKYNIGGEVLLSAW